MHKHHIILLSPSSFKVLLTTNLRPESVIRFEVDKSRYIDECATPTNSERNIKSDGIGRDVVVNSMMSNELVVEAY